jgi:hypothetical protein
MPGYIHTCASCGAHMQVHERYLGRNLRCTSCRTEFLAALPEDVDPAEAAPAPAPAVPDAPVRGRSRRLLWIAGALVIAAAAVWFLGQDHDSGVLFRPQRTVGEIAELRSDEGGPVVVAFDRTAVERLVKGGASPSSAAAREVVENGHGLEIAAGTKARVLERADRGRLCRVRILDGSWSSRIVWVPSRWVW